MKAGEPIEPFSEIISHIESLVIAGNLKESRELFESVNPKHIPRPSVFRFAELACRIQFPLYALKALHLIINPKNTFAKPATTQERMIYASALLKLGALNEALAILESLDSQEQPDVLFYKALSSFHQWNYLDSIPLWEEFIKSDKITSYRRLVAQMNLAAAYVYI